MEYKFWYRIGSMLQEIPDWLAGAIMGVICFVITLASGSTPAALTFGCMWAVLVLVAFVTSRNR